MKLLLLLFTVLFAGCNADQIINPPDITEPEDFPGKWERMTNMPNIAQENSVTEMNGRLYLSGGMTNNDFTGYVNKIYEYNSTEDIWTEFAEFDKQIHHHSSASVNGVLYVIGGYAGAYPYGALLTSVYALDSVSGIWEEKAGLPQPIAAGTAITYKNEIYFFGGVLMFNSGLYNSDVLKYIPEKDEWQQVGTFVRTREHMSAVVQGKKIYIVGGRKFDNGFTTFAYLDAYDPEKNEWEQLTDIPVVTSASSVATLNGKIYTFGGERAIGQSSFTMVEKAYEYTLSKGQWRQVENLYIHGTNAITIGTAIFVAGGGNMAGIVNAQSTTFKFTID